MQTLRLSVPVGKRVKVKEGKGCHECRGTGYFGRTGIFEILPVDDAVKHLIVRPGADAPQIKREAVKNGMRTLRQSALRKLAEGVDHVRGSGPRHRVVVGMVFTIPTTTVSLAPRTAHFVKACQ